MEGRILQKDDIFNLVRDFLVKDFECDAATLNPSSRLVEDLDLDSIDAVDLIVKLQQVTGKKIDPETFRQVRNIGDVVDAIQAIYKG